MSKNGAKLVPTSHYVATAMVNELMVRAIKMSEMPKKNEVQKHGFTWEGEVIRNVYKCMTTTPYTGAVDLPAHLNNLEACRVSIKTTGSPNAVCMGDCLRVYDSVDGDAAPIHATVMTYVQNDETKTKKIKSIVEVDITNSRTLLFGNLSRAQIEELDQLIKRVPQKRSPTPEEHKAMYTLRDALHALAGPDAAIHLNIKCDSQQSRLQCSFNRWLSFVANHPERVVAVGDASSFRGGSICAEISSGRRTFKKKKTTQAPEPEPEPEPQPIIASSLQ
jgi:hypothetical protein